jgi:hypothetical protein
MINDGDLAEALTPSVRALPYPGTWLEAPYDKPTAVVARDSHYSEIRVDRRNAAVTVVDLEAERISPLAPDLASLVSLAEAYSDAFARTSGADDDQLEQIAEQLREQLLAIDPSLLDDEDGFWAVAVEDLELGLIGADSSADVTIVSPAMGPLVFIALPPLELNQQLATEGLNLLSYTEHLSFSAWHGSAREALAGRSGPHGHQQVEVVVTITASSVPTTTDLAAAPELSLHVHLGSEPAPTLPTERPLEQIVLPQAGPFIALAELIDARFRPPSPPLA